MTKKEKMTDQIDIQKISDLELAEFLSAQISLLSQTQQNVAILQAELQRRKQLLVEAQNEIHNQTTNTGI